MDAASAARACGRASRIGPRQGRALVRPGKARFCAGAAVLVESAAMSRILLFSDSHGVAAAMKSLRARVEADAPDLVCFLGDEKRSIP